MKNSWNLVRKTLRQGVPSWFSRLSIYHCHCYDSGLISDLWPATSACHGCRKKKKDKKDTQQLGGISSPLHWAKEASLKSSHTICRIPFTQHSGMAKAIRIEIEEWLPEAGGMEGADNRGIRRELLGVMELFRMQVVVAVNMSPCVKIHRTVKIHTRVRACTHTHPQSRIQAPGWATPCKWPQAACCHWLWPSWKTPFPLQGTQPRRPRRVQQDRDSCLKRIEGVEVTANGYSVSFGLRMFWN